MRSAHVYMAIAIAAFGVFSAVHQIEFDRQDRVLALLDEARRLETGMALDVVKARVGLTNNFDGLAQSQLRMRAIIGALKESSDAIFGRGDTDVDNDIILFEKHTAQLEILLEDFKSSSAIASNSLRYLPTAMTDARSAWSSGLGSKNEPRILNNLHRAVLEFHLNNDASGSKHLRQIIDAVDQDGLLSKGDLNEPVTRLLAHATNVLVYGSRALREALDVIELVQMEPEAEILVAYRTFDHRRQDRTQNIVAILAATSTAFLGLVAFAVFSLRRAGMNLRRVNESLEAQVEERTEDIRDKNERLTLEIAERERAENIKQEFLSVASHELRTPLTSIKGSLGLVRSGAIEELPTKIQPMLNIAYANCERLELLVNDILDIEKMTQGMYEFDLKPIDVASLLDSAIDANAGFGEQYGVVFVKDNIDDGLMVCGDEDRLAQVVSNLMANAAKYSAREKKVEVSLARLKDDIRIAVKDYGKGIPEEFQERVFEKFAQADSSDTRQLGGTGLGLSICKAIVEQHGGKIGFETKVGHGTTFFADLPLYDEPAMARTL